MPETEEHGARQTTIRLNRREFSRFPAQVESVTLRKESGEQVAAKVKDESFVGIGLWLEDGANLSMREPVWVEYKNISMPAVVRRIETQVSGAVLAGLEWIAPPPVM